MKKNKNYYIRKIHRFMGIIIGIQFLMWTLGGLYFSWTDIDEIHGDHFLKQTPAPAVSGLMGLDEIAPDLEISQLQLIFISEMPYYWINGEKLIDARTGVIKEGVSQKEALEIAKDNLAGDYEPLQIEYMTETGPHHEYREQPLPAWAIHYDQPDRLTVYVSAQTGAVQRLRHRSWRWFDFLWMAHTMDYNSRDDINNWLLRTFSVLGILTISSGFLLFYISSPTLRKLRNKISKS